MSSVEVRILDTIVERVERARKEGITNPRDRIVGTIYRDAELIAGKVVKERRALGKAGWDSRLDDILTSRWLGYPAMFFLLGIVFWLTLAGANYPSRVLATALFWGEERLAELLVWAGAPGWTLGFFVEGVYRTAAWVVSVMLPPMAIFFPLFTFLEDLGYLPRVAFNLDHLFKKAGTHGKQALTMSMGFGCNAAGVIACRVIESPRERLIAMLTNVFVPCNGRFPALIALASIFMGGTAAAFGTVVAAATVAMLVLVGIFISLVVSWLLSRTLLRGEPSVFTLELPPFRKPALIQVLVRSLHERTVFVLTRAVLVAAPVGGLNWLLANLKFGGASVLAHLAQFLDPVGKLLGLDGFILMAFIVGIPANEIVLPVLIMGYLSAGAMVELQNLTALKELLMDHRGWTWLTALCTMLFSLLHYPCATTLLTIRRETNSVKWMVLAALVPLLVACAVCFAVAQAARGMGLV